MRENRQAGSPEARERCVCAPLSARRRAPEGARTFVPVSLLLGQTLQATLASSLVQALPCSLLVLHITQFEPVSPTPMSTQNQEKVCYHAPATFLGEIVQMMRRSLRANDQILVEESGSGAAIFLPGVDQEGIARIARRISQSLHLLQAETVVPPLRYETEIVFGLGAYAGPPAELVELLEQASRVYERILFRPAVVLRPVESKKRPERAEKDARLFQLKDVREREARASGIPFMQIPSRLPVRLQQILPYALALELRCAPVGRDHNRLTVAMENPTDTRIVAHLRTATGMTIFPVSCEIAALEKLLASGW